MGFRETFIKRWKIYISIILGIFILLLILLFATKEDVRRDKTYVGKNDVALYIKKYHELPKNYLTKFGKDYYYNKNVNLSSYLVGGDTFYNDGKLKSFDVDNDRMLKECDIYFDGYSCTSNRGKYRLVYETNKGDARIFYTDDHYDSFDEITLFNLMPRYITFIIILVVYSISCFVFLLCIYAPNIKKRLSKNESTNN